MEFDIEGYLKNLTSDGQIRDRIPKNRGRTPKRRTLKIFLDDKHFTVDVNPETNSAIVRNPEGYPYKKSLDGSGCQISVTDIVDSALEDPNTVAFASISDVITTHLERKGKVVPKDKIPLTYSRNGRTYQMF